MCLRIEFWHCKLYHRGGQTFLIAGQIWKLFLIAGRTIQNCRHKSNNFCKAEKKKVFLMLNEMKNVQFLTNFVLIDHIMLLSTITKRGPRAAKISWMAAFWPSLYYYMASDIFRFFEASLVSFCITGVEVNRSRSFEVLFFNFKNRSQYYTLRNLNNFRRFFEVFRIQIRSHLGFNEN